MDTKFDLEFHTNPPNYKRLVQTTIAMLLFLFAGLAADLGIMYALSNLFHWKSVTDVI